MKLSAFLPVVLLLLPPEAAADPVFLSSTAHSGSNSSVLSQHFALDLAVDANGLYVAGTVFRAPHLDPSWGTIPTHFDWWVGRFDRGLSLSTSVVYESNSRYNQERCSDPTCGPTSSTDYESAQTVATAPDGRVYVHGLQPITDTSNVNTLVDDTPRLRVYHSFPGNTATVGLPGDEDPYLRAGYRRSETGPWNAATADPADAYRNRYLHRMWRFDRFSTLATDSGNNVYLAQWNSESYNGSALNKSTGTFIRKYSPGLGAMLAEYVIPVRKEPMQGGGTCTQGEAPILVYGLKVAADGSVYAGGVADYAQAPCGIGAPAQPDIWLAKFSANLVLLASTTLNGPLTKADWIKDLAIGPDGNLFAAGTVNSEWHAGRRSGLADGDDQMGTWNSELWVGKFAPDLSLLAQATVAGPAGKDDFATSIAVDPGGTVFVGGRKDGLSGTGWIFRFDPNLTLLSETSVSPAEAQVESLELDPANPVFLYAAGNHVVAGSTRVWVSRYLTGPINDPTAAAPSDITGASVRANWGANGNPPATSYLAEIDDAAAFSSVDASSTTRNLYAVFSGLGVNKRYHLRVRSADMVGSPFVLVGAPFTSAAVPSEPGIFHSAVSTHGFTVAWLPNGNPAGTDYVCEISRYASFSPVAASSTTKALSATFAGLPPGTGFWVRVKALNGDGAATQYRTFSYAVGTQTPPPGAAAVSGITETSLQANWTANGSPQGTQYTVELDDAADFSSVDHLSSTPNDYAVFTGLEPDTVYHVRVRTGSSGYTSLGQAVTLAYQPLAQEGEPFSGVGSSQFTAHWWGLLNRPGTDFVCQVSTDAAFGAILRSSTTRNQSATFSGLAVNVRYFARVAALNQAGVPTAYLPIGDGVTTPANAPGAAAYSEVTAIGFRANWTANGNPAGTTYLITVGQTPSAAFLVAYTQDVTAAFSGLPSSTRYYVKVRVSDGSGSAYTDLGPVATLATTPVPASASGGQDFTQSGPDGISAYWQSPQDAMASLFVTEMSENASFDPIFASTVTDYNGATFTGLPLERAFHVRVKAVNPDGIASAYMVFPTQVVTAYYFVPGAAPWSSLGPAELKANWAPNGNQPGTRYQTDISLAADFSSVLASSVTRNLHATFPGLAVDTRYYGRVKVAEGASKPYTSLGAGRTLAHTPVAASAGGGQDFTAVSGIGFTANWGSGGNAAGTTYVSEVLQFGGLVASSATRNGFAAFTGLMPRSLYTVRVKALNGDNVATPYMTFPQQAATGPASPSTAPFSSVGFNGFYANWGPNGNPAGTNYLAEVSADPGFASIAQSVATTGGYAAFSGLTNGTQYFARVKVSDNPPSAFADLGPVSTLNYNPPGAAGWSSVTGDAFQANWFSNGNPPGLDYLAEIATDSGFSTIVRSSATRNFYAGFTGLASGTPYYGRVKVTNGPGTAFTALGTVTPVNDPFRPAALPFSNVGIPNAQSFRANWTAAAQPPGAQYKVEQALNSSFVPLAYGASFTYGTYQDLFGVTNTRYHVRVQNNSYPSAPTYLGTVTTLASLPSSYPDDYFCYDSGGSPLQRFVNVAQTAVTVQWCSYNPAGTAHIVEISTHPAFTPVWASSQTVLTTLNPYSELIGSVRFTGLLAGTPYYARVRALNLDNVATADHVFPTNAVTTLFPVGAAPITGLSSTTLRVNWTANGNPPDVSYTVAISTMASFSPRTQFTVGELTFSQLFTGLKPGATYFARVSGLGAGGSTGFTQLGSARALSCTGPLGYSFTDPALAAGATRIRKVHLTELRDSVDALRANASLPAFPWTDGTITAGATRIRAVHFAELRTALSAVYAACGQAAPAFSDAGLTAGVNPIRAAHIAELRTLVQNAP